MSTNDPQPDWVRLEERAKAAFDQGNLLHARDLLLEASGAVGADSIVFSNLGLAAERCLRAAGDLDAATDVLRAAAEAGEPRAYLDLADVEHERGDLDASEAAFEAAIAAGVAEQADDDEGAGS